MMKRTAWVLAFAALAFLFVVPAHADSDKPVQGYIAGGYVTPVGTASDYADAGWNLSGGLILRPAAGNSNFGVRFDFAYNEFNAKQALIDEAGGSVRTTGGWVTMATITADALYHFGREDGVKGYVGAGIGAYRRYMALTQDVYSNGYWCDPWTGWCYPTAGFYPAVTQDDKLTKIGYNAVLGVTFPVGGGDMFVEAQYNYMLTEKGTTYVPIVLGYRF